MSAGMTQRQRFHLRQSRFFLVGAALLSVLSLIQKLAIGAPITVGGFLIPVIYGGISGALIGLWAGRLQERNQQLEQALTARRWMLRDLHHRVQNNLQVVSSILDLEQSENSVTGRVSGLRIDLIAALAAQISAEVHIDWHPTLRGSISFSQEQQRWYGEAAMPKDRPVAAT